MFTAALQRMDLQDCGIEMFGRGLLIIIIIRAGLFKINLVRVRSKTKDFIFNRQDKVRSHGDFHIFAVTPDRTRYVLAF